MKTSFHQSIRNVITASAMGLVLALSIGSNASFAHDNDTLDKMKSPNGGQVRMAGMYHFELVMNKDSKGQKEDTITIYVTDHISNKIATKGATGTITILSGKNKTTLALTEDGDNKLKAKAKYVADAKLKVVLAINMPAKPVEQAQFTPFKPAKKEATMGDHAMGHDGHEGH